MHKINSRIYLTGIKILQSIEITILNPFLDMVLELEDSTPNHEYQDLDIKLVGLICWKSGRVSDGIDFSLVQTSILPRQWKAEGSLKL